MDPIVPNTAPGSPDLSFQVMPQDLGHPEKNISMGSVPPPTPVPPMPRPPMAPRPDMVMPPPAHPEPANNLPQPNLPSDLPSDNDGPRRLMIIVAAIIILAVAGVGIYYYLTSKKSSTATPAAQQAAVSKLPKVWLNQYFNSDTCSDQTVCGDNADPDHDGLVNYDEFKNGSSPTDPDTDKDGLADGDEVHVYKTEPTLKYTDRRDIVQQNDWTDSVQIKNGYDPLTPGKPFTDARLAQIAADTATYPLHEPTITSLKPTGTTSQSNAKSVTVAIETGKFNPATITVNKGDSVVWLNKDTAKHHIASDPHPSHSGLPGFESPDLAANQTYSFTFTKTGSFGYHDDLNLAVKGTVVVK